MGVGRLNNWMWRLQSISVGLLALAAFAPLSSTLHRILLGMAAAGMGIHLVSDSPASRKRLLRFLILVAAFMILALLFSFGPHLVFGGIVGVWAGTILWEVFREEHAEYLARRDGD